MPLASLLHPILTTSKHRHWRKSVVASSSVRTVWKGSVPYPHLSLLWEPSLDGHMGTNVKQPHSSFMFTLHGNTRWRQKPQRSHCMRENIKISIYQKHLLLNIDKNKAHSPLIWKHRRKHFILNKGQIVFRSISYMKFCLGFFPLHYYFYHLKLGFLRNLEV